MKAMRGVLFDTAVATVADFGFAPAEHSTLSRHITLMRKHWSGDEICDAFDHGQQCTSQLDIVKDQINYQHV